MAADYYEAIIDYGLDQKPITDDELMLLIGETLLETIDSSQNRRSRSFGENMELTRSILETVRDHPEYSQDNIKEIVGCSKGKVNKVINRFKEGGYADDIDFNIEIKGVIYSPTGEIVEQTDTVYNNKDNINDNNNDNYNCIDRDYDRCAVMSSDRSVGVANAPGSADATQLYLPVELLIKGIEKLNLKFEGLISNEDMPKIIARTYEQRMRNNEEELTKKDIYMLMVEEVISHPYLCEREPVEIACAYACGVKRKVSGSNPGDAA